MPGALPAVTVPSVASPRSPDASLGRANAGLSFASASMLVSRRGPSSASTTVSRPRASRTVTGTSSSAKRPASMAATARRWLSRAKASWSERLTRSLIATRSACVPMWQSSIAHQRPSWTVESTSTPSPRRYPKRASRSRNGAWFMLSIPPATATSASPARISAAASMIAFSPEPQTRLIVVALVVTGRPALSAAWRAGAWPTPAWRTWPMRTSSTAVPSGSPERSTAARIATPPSSVAGTVESAAAELADGRPGGADEVDVAVWRGLLHLANVHRRRVQARV